MVLPEVITGGVTTGHNAHHIDLHGWKNALDQQWFVVGPPAAGATAGKDKAAVEAAFDAASASLYGGVVQLLGRAVYDVGDLDLVWPAAKSVTLIGGGATYLHFSTDRAAGTFAMSGPAVRLRDLIVVGPGTSFVPGTSPANVRAVEMRSRANLQDVIISGFHAGVQVVGDHTYMQTVKIQNCFYGEEFANGTTFGDHTRVDCDYSNNLRASIMVQTTGVMDACTYVRGHLGWTPFDIEFAAGGAPGWIGMVNTQFFGTAWEYHGNGMFYCSDRNVLTSDVEIVGARPLTSNPAFKIAALAMQPDVYLGTVSNWRINGDGPTTWDCVVMRGCMWDGWRSAFDRAVGAAVTFIRAYMGLAGNNGTLRLTESNSRAVAMNVTAAVAIGQVVEYTESPHYVRPHNPSGANGGSMIAGVALSAATSADDVCIVALEDYEGVAVQVAGAGPYGVNDMLFAVGTTGKVDNAAGAGGSYANKAIVGRVGTATAVSGGKLAGVIVKVTDRAT